jgi:hypothetical protein
MKRTLLAALTMLLCSTAAMAQPTGSDTCANATPISGTGLFNFNNQNVGPYEADFATCGMSKDVWFRWTAPGAGQVIFTTCGLAESDTVLAVYAGSSCSGGAIACNDDAACGPQSTVIFNAVAGGVYTLQVGSYWASAVGWFGQFSLSFPPPPTTYDSCGAAQAISGTGVFSFDTTSATSSSADPFGCSLIGRDVWFNWTPSTSGRAFVTTCGQGVAFSTVLAAYTNTCAATAQPLDCNQYDSGCAGSFSTISFIVSTGQTYKLRVGSANGVSGGPGHFAISLTPAITNDECSTATAISGTGLFAFNNATATDSDVGHTDCGQPGRDVWFRWTAPATSQTTITTCGLITDMNTVLVLYADQCPVGPLPLQCNDDATNCGTQSRLDFLAHAGTSYLLRIGSSLGTSFTTAGHFSIAQAPPGGGGETITVTTLNDVTDFAGFQQVIDLPGPDGRISFREAVTAANNTPGAQTIAFAIPVSEFWLVTDMALLKLEQDAFFLNDSGTTVDFSTQTANIGDTNPNGPEVGFYGLQPNGAGVAAMFVNGDNCVIKGLGRVYQRGYGIQLVGDNNRVIGCQISGALHAAVIIEGYMGGPTPTGNTVGGTAPGEGNSLIGLVINGPSEGNIVIGNSLLVGVNVQGATQFGVIARNNRIGGPTPSERNVISGAGFYGEEGFPVGDQVAIIDADGTTVEGNYIGTTADGMHAYSPQIGPIGVEVRDSRSTTIRGNLIAGLRVVGTNHAAGLIFGQAVYVGAVNANTQSTVIQGNTIGLAADGVTPIATRSGISVSPAITVLHAFSTLISTNHVASVETTGVFVAAQENGVTITRNSIHDCGGLGIDLAPSGPTPNDPGDGDDGANGLQNYPVIASAAATLASGTLESTPGEAFTLEFFASQACDPTGFGEGAVFVGSMAITTDGSGQAAFAAPLSPPVQQGWVLTATATRTQTGDTSEFSACVVVSAGAVCSADFNCDGDVGTDADIESFFACLAGSCPSLPCLSTADFNGDGDVGTDADIESFFRVLAGGPC